MDIEMNHGRINPLVVLLIFVAAALVLFGNMVFSDGLAFPAHTDAFLPWRSDLTPEREAEVFEALNRAVTDKNFSFNPDNQVACRAMQDGRLPLWNPYQMAGLPYLGQSLYGVFYPLNLPLFLMGPQKCYVPLTILHFILAGFFTFLLLRGLGLSTPSAILGGLAFMCCANMTARFHYYMTIYPLTWAPLMLHVVHRYHQRPTLRHLGGLALMTAMIIFAGFQQMAIYVLYAVFGFSFVCAASGRYGMRVRRGLFVVGIIIVFAVVSCFAGLHPWLAYSFALLAAVPAFLLAGRGVVPWLKAVFPVACALVLGVAVSAVQMAPVFALMPHSMRALIPPVTMINDLHMPAGGLLGLVFPMLLGDPMWAQGVSPLNLAGMVASDGRVGLLNHVENSLYIGLLPLALLLFIRFRAPGSGKMAYFLILGLVLLFVGMGIAFVVYPVWFFPGFQTGDPRRALLAFSFFASLVAAFGFEKMLMQGSSRSWPMLIAALLIVLGIGLGAVGQFYNQPLAEALHSHVTMHVDPSGTIFPGEMPEGMLMENARHLRLTCLHAGLASVLGGVALLLWAATRRGFALALVMVAVLIDGAWVSWHVNPLQKGEGFLRTHPAIECMLPQSETDHFRLFRYTEDTRSSLRIPFPSNMTTHFNLEDVEGYVVQSLKRFFTLVSAIQPDPPIASGSQAIWPLSRPEALHSPILDLIGVRYMLATREISPDTGFEKVHEQKGMWVYRNSQTFPRAFFVPKARFFDPDDPESEIKVMTALLAKGNDLRSEVMIESKPIDYTPAEGPLPEARVIYPTPEHAEVTFDSPASGGFLVLADAFYPGWEAMADETPVEVLPAYHAFRGVAVPEGTRKVTFRFNPPEVKIGALITFVSLLLALGALVKRPRPE